MAEYTLKVNEATGKVRYLMKQSGANVVGETSVQSAMWMLKRGEVKRTDEFEGFPLTADGVYFFEGEEDSLSQPQADSSLGEGAKGTTSSGAAADPQSIARTAVRKGEGFGNGESVALDKRRYKESEDGVEIGADGAPIPAGDGGKRRRKKRIKDEVCQ